MEPATRFDAAYFERFYESRVTRVYGPRQIAALARGVTGLIEWLGGDLEAVLDVGAGTGLWRDWFARHKKGVRYRSLDVSPYACRKYGHELADITRFRTRERFDLVVCQGVVPYLDDAGAAAAIDNIARACRGFLYFEAVTAKDLRGAADPAFTDLTMRARPARFYRGLLAPSFDALGLGLHYAKRARPLSFYELDLPPRTGRG
jgi:SAM-dependent methyltransferase